MPLLEFPFSVKNITTETHQEILKARVQFYNTNIQSRTILYCSTIWGSVSDTTQLFKHHKRAIRLITDEHYRAYTKDLFSKLNIMPIHDRVNYRMVCTVHKALHNQMSEYIANMFDGKTRTATRNTRERALKISNHKRDDVS